MRTPKTTLEQWRALHAVAEAGGFHQAAEQLHKSQSAISYSIAKLQEQLGVTLLETEGRKSHLNVTGKMLLARSREVLEQASRLEALAEKLSRGWEPEITLAVDLIFPNPWLIEILRRFAPFSAQTRLRVMEEVLSGGEEALLSEQANLALLGFIPQGFLGNHVAQIEFVAVAHPEHALLHKSTVLTQDDLKQELQIVIRDTGSKNRDAGWLGAARRWTVSSPATSVAMISAGLGFAWLPRHIIADKLSSGELVELPLKTGKTRTVPIFLVYADEALAGPATLELAQQIESVCYDFST